MAPVPDVVTRLGVIRNPTSQRNRRRVAIKHPRHSAVELVEIEPRSKDDLPEVVEEMSQRDIRHLVVDGGDGTLRDVMTALPAAYGHALPTLTLFAGGNANLASADVGTAGHGAAAMAALLASLAQPDGGKRIRRAPIQVRWPDDSHRPVLGFFIGAAGFYHGWKLARGSVHQRGLLHGPAVAATIAAAAFKSLAGSSRNQWQSGTAMDVDVDEMPNPEGNRFLFIATSLHRLYGSLWPFFDHDERSIRWLDIAAPPPGFARALPSLLRGRPRPWLRESGAYRSGGASQLRLRLETPIVIDGEVHTPGAYGIVELHSGPEIEFYTP